MKTEQQRAPWDVDTRRGERRAWWAPLVAPPTTLSTILCLVGAVLLVGSSVIHLHLWSTGYRHIPTIGPLFLLQGVVGIVLALVVAATRRSWAALVGGLFAASTIGGLILSVEVGLFGFRDSLSAPDATLSLVVESAATVVLIAAVALASLRPRHVGVRLPA
jgi:hypothetical protein